MDNYYLFLDESKPNGSNLNHLCLAGVIIQKDIYEKQIIPKINTLKNSIFNNTQVILHEVEVRKAKDEFVEFRKEPVRTLFWNELNSIFNSYPIHTIGAAIDIKSYQKLYPPASLNEDYFIVLQIVLENFVHFLETHNAVGSIYIESTNPTDDIKLKNLYHKIIANGTLYLNKNVFQDKLLNINFLIKADNNIGLQLADFIPGTLNRKCNGLAPKNPNIYDSILHTLYDGTHSQTERFGFKVMP